MCFIHICRSMLVVIIPGALLVRDKTCRNKTKSLPLCCSLVYVNKKIKKDNSCTFPVRERRVSFTKPDGDLP